MHYKIQFVIQPSLFPYLIKHWDRNLNLCDHKGKLLCLVAWFQLTDCGFRIFHGRLLIFTRFWLSSTSGIYMCIYVLTHGLRNQLTSEVTYSVCVGKKQIVYVSYKIEFMFSVFGNVQHVNYYIRYLKVIKCSYFTLNVFLL